MRSKLALITVQTHVRQHEFGKMLPPADTIHREREIPVGISHFKVIPKPHQTGKWRPITDLSSPEGASVNDGMDPK